MNEDRIIVVDDEEDALISIRATLRSFRYGNVKTFNCPEQLMPFIDDKCVVLVILDLVMPGISGEELLKILTEHHPEIPVIITTGIDEIKTAVRCMRLGAVDYIVKPIEREHLKVAVKNALDRHDLARCNRALSDSLMKKELTFPEAFSRILTSDHQMKTIFRYIEAIAPSSGPVLITGETGTGKELIAQAVHRASRRSGSFVPVNIGGCDDTMLSDMLFGHEKGAFTGAQSIRSGLTENAANGTLFLDEIGDLSSFSQVKILRLLQEQEFQPLGSDRTRRASCRIVAATSKSIEELSNSSGFRRDLFYRLKMHHIHLPPLRERKRDLQLLVPFFLDAAAKEYGKKTPTPPKEIFQLLETWHFPGNVRELKSIIYDAVAKHTEHIMSLAPIRSAIGLDTRHDGSPITSSALSDSIIFPESLPTFKETEQQLLEEALRRTNGNRSLAAALLGVSKSAITQRLNKSSP